MKKFIVFLLLFLFSFGSISYSYDLVCDPTDEDIQFYEVEINNESITDDYLPEIDNSIKFNVDWIPCGDYYLFRIRRNDFENEWSPWSEVLSSYKPNMPRGVSYENGYLKTYIPLEGDIVKFYDIEVDDFILFKNQPAELDGSLNLNLSMFAESAEIHTFRLRALPSENGWGSDWTQYYDIYFIPEPEPDPEPEPEPEPEPVTPPGLDKKEKLPPGQLKKK
jgi:hypothetical protein